MKLDCAECRYWGTGCCSKHRPVREPSDRDGIEHDILAFGEVYVRVGPQ
ncbi:hypothetical protein SEA_POCAHONTAS_36 [Mycobacterium phage Pocahontas]|uniref:Uncharacterized protein n=1 Tax=Mycobacterium phage Veracruz TaxID=2530154 RepID=A0A481VT22_9CAUD|nr:hypothetical protein KIP27_gp57 [Mycobacterium phage Veracruz]AIS73709.1 hypothetical protein PBI_QUINNKIRO_35 [Mycobacterium phage QuinnKiro]ALA11838.1 hypothetical protein SEA_TEXAGE_35 [Mycobacterium phage Texage]AOT24185.1 hypothetical protein SEA_TODACORO_36 [Mycobacterium phage Todacoro]AOT25538.1 hypothetical protein SEA_MARGO_36 [Mycobacterium phage Margo]AUX82332.1 hypothetical protein SEA_LAMBERT1_36 [Mycobacterium phage Lambert1]AWY03567.1 hypothetical protein SEA_HOOKMOUNT_36 [